MRYLYTIISVFIIIFVIFSLTQLTINKIDVKYDSAICIEPFNEYMYKTCAPLFYDIDDDIVVIPAGFKTDLASIPRSLWSFISPARSDLMGASILHDFLYQCPTGIKRKDADDIFYNAMIGHGVKATTAIKLYLSVRLFGYNHFNQDTDCYIGIMDDGYVETRGSD